MNLRERHIHATCFLIMICLLVRTSPAVAEETITLQLKWTHAFQFAGYYAAKEKGFYQQAGLDVNIVEAVPGVDPVKNVLDGRAQFGVGTSSLLLERRAGKPVVVLAVIFQHSPYVLIARQDSSTQGIHDLVDKRLMIEPLSNELLAYLKAERVPLDRVKLLEHTFNPQDLIDGKTDAISAYVTNQPYFLDRAHYRYQVYTPRSAGIDFYGDNLFTTEQELKRHPERVKAFRAASLKGWQYAMEHQEEIANLIYAKYSQRKPLDYYRFEATRMMPLLRPELIEIGYMYSGRWRHIADTYADLGLLPRDYSLEGFLYDPNPRVDMTRLYVFMGILGLILGVIVPVTLYIYRINRRLTRTLADREQATSALQHANALLYAAMDQSAAGIAIADAPSGALRYVNDAGLQIRGGDRQGVIGSGMDQYVAQWHLLDLDGQPLKPEEVPLARAILSGKPYSREFIIQRAAGDERHIFGNAAPIRDETGNVVAGIVVFTDFTERKHAEDERDKLAAQLQQAQKMESVGRLAGGVAHDFNNMLSVILGHVEMLLKQVSQFHPFHKSLTEIREAAQHSADLTRQLLAFASKQAVMPRVLNINEAVDRSLKMLHRLIGENVRLEWRPGKELWPVKIDPSQLTQIITNLCANARDAISNVGQIAIATENCAIDAAYCENCKGSSPGDYVLLSVSDTGCGMDKATLEHIFEPFFTTKMVGKGTGLGLATVYGAVRQNRGFVEVCSEPGQGTTFRIFLPRTAETADQERQDQEAQLAARGQEIILLVEDEPAILKMTTAMLECQGYTVISADGPAEALRLAKECTSEINLLITDVIMPEMNGRDLAEELRLLHPHLKLLFMSGYTADIIASQGKLDETVCFIPKPFSINELSAKVRETLERK